MSSSPPKIVFQGDGTAKLIGYREWVNDLRRINPEVAKEVKRNNKDLAKLVKQRAIAEAATDREKKVAKSLKVTATLVSGRITIAPTAALSDAFGREFGAKHDIHRGVKGWWVRKVDLEDPKPGMRGWNQFAPWRGNQWEQPSGDDMGGPPAGVGYFLWPAIRKSRQDISDAYEKGVMLAIERSRAFPDAV